jgi:chemotaxis family two-component system response regulator Rcp1
MSRNAMGGTYDILLVEDNLGDVRLTREALKDGKAVDLHVVREGAQAIAFLRREAKYADAPRPDLVLLDLSLPRRNGREVLAEIKGDPNLKRIPVVILTASQVEQDILMSYDLHANCYVIKPEDPEQFIVVVQSIERFWLRTAKLPSECLWIKHAPI